MPAALPRPARLTALDAFRGFVMLLMAAELLELPGVARHFPDSAVWQFIARHTSHVAWTGCSLHDLIQPSFSFIVGVALPFSLGARLARGEKPAALWLHALWRSLLLVLLGVFLRSIGSPITNWTFEDTLSQIGLGYPFLFLLGFAGGMLRWTALAALLAGYWLVFALFPLAPPDFNYTAANVKPNWPHHFEGFAAHWNINSNAAWAFDVWFLNLFPRELPFVGNRGGYSTLSFIPTLATMVLGLIAGAWLKRAGEEAPDAPEGGTTQLSTASAAAPTSVPKPQDTPAMAATVRLIYAGLACLAAGWVLHTTGICPIVKKLWTPAWTLFSGGWCFLLMATFYFITDVQGWKRWAFPLVVVGMNSIAMYVLAHTVTDFFKEALVTHFGKSPFLVLGESLEPVLLGGCVLLILWLILWWMYRRNIFLRV